MGRGKNMYDYHHSCEASSDLYQKEEPDGRQIRC